jgi:hypothetical protein
LLSLSGESKIVSKFRRRHPSLKSTDIGRSRGLGASRSVKIEMDHTASAFRLTSSKPPPTSATFRPCRAEIKTQEVSPDFWSVTRRVTIGDTQTPVTQPSTQTATSGAGTPSGGGAAGAGTGTGTGTGRSPDGNAWRRDRAAEKRAALPTGAYSQRLKMTATVHKKDPLPYKTMFQVVGVPEIWYVPVPESGTQLGFF